MALLLITLLMQLRGVYLGHSAPRVTSVKVVPSADGSSTSAGSFGVQEELSLDCSFAWSSRMEGEQWCTCTLYGRPRPACPGSADVWL